MVVAFINCQGSVNSRPLLKLVKGHLLWFNQHILSIQAVHVPLPFQLQGVKTAVTGSLYISGFVNPLKLN